MQTDEIRVYLCASVVKNLSKIQENLLVDDSYQQYLIKVNFLKIK